MLLHLPERVPGKLVDQNELARDLERCEFLPATGLEVSGGDGPGGYDVSHRHFATDAIGRGGDSGFCNAILLFEKFFDLAWIDVKAAGDDEIAFAAAQCV